MATVNIGISVSLAKHLCVTYAPAVVAINDGHLNYFTGTIATSEIKKFLKGLLPNVALVSVLSCP